MSAAAALAKLPSPLRDLVAGAAQDGSEDFGKSEKDKAEVAEWIDKVAQGDVAKPESLKDLEASLVPRTYLVSNYFTAADAALYGALHPVLSQLQPAQYYSQPAITRYFDHVQHRASIRKAAEPLAPAFSIVAFNLENAPHQERKAEAPKKKEKAKAAPATEAETPAAPVKAEKAAAKAEKKAKTEQGEKAAEQPQEGAKELKTQKKEKKVKEPKAAEKKPAEDAGEPSPSMIDLRVGHIVDIKKHPDADGLYVEQIDFGEETGPRTVVSGLVNYIPIEDMRDKYLVGVCNLKPANMRGVKSFAMVLCATHKDGKDAGIELVQPPAGSKVGERIFFEGFEGGEPLSQLNPKKKIFETVQPGFTTLDTREAAWVDPATKSVHRIRTKDGVCVAPRFVGASLS
ncbi:nucleic acid-binding protein [Trametes versicolor FP-101664 SS1]|uniref:nucleic acid-binding protein n=1 Tax=Trametes versicolor (strain FP-101664) TaxID=717944 RepID=UPI00046213DB|nr:nucleic acid-binding protein [Trametes versicolor FP-101664 SS1]EIW59492.1 nucleic acid-binding protein [Trametes versicolor FP-101664 SS1]